jgi:hypothetical protein
MIITLSFQKIAKKRCTIKAANFSDYECSYVLAIVVAEKGN